MAALISIATICGAQISTPAAVDLTSNPTRFKNQGSRGSCITFAAVAALEAAYKHVGYGDLDLSEEFLSG